MDILDEDKEFLLEAADRIGAWISVGLVIAGFMIAMVVLYTHWG